MLADNRVYPAPNSTDPVSGAKALIDTAWHEPLDLTQLSRRIGFSRYHLIRAFRKQFGITPHRYLVHRRIEKAQYLLVFTDLSVTEICFAVGFQSLGSFSTLFRRSTGRSPVDHRARIAEQEAELRRRVPACFIQMQGLDQSYTTEQFSRSLDDPSLL